MKKNEKIMIGILVLILLVLIGFYIFREVRMNQNVGATLQNRNVVLSETNQYNDTNKIGRIVKVNGTLYYDTGKVSENVPRCGMMDGSITKVIKETENPINDGEANFEGAEGYQYGRENTIEIPLDGGWLIFEAKEENSGDEHFFYGKVIESNQNNILVEPNKDEDIRKSADKIFISLGKHNDAIYEVGTNVKITYTGYVMETYPAKVEATKIELKSVEEFEIRFYDKQPQTETKVHKILDKTETNKYDYDVYTYEGSVNIIINGEEISLRNTLLNNKITMNEIIAKANEDLSKKIIKGDMYRDGGSMIYQYDNYTIIKCHTLDGNRDVYIGTKGMTINDVI